MEILKTLWQDATFIAIDLETTGKYPLDAEICEMAAVKWKNGQIVEEYQTLIKPTYRMSDEVIAIHHISNEMVENAPPFEDVAHDIYHLGERKALLWLFHEQAFKLDPSI